MLNETTVEVDKGLVKTPRKFMNWKFIVISVVIIIALIFTAYYYYRETRFNANIMINHIQVGGLTADQAIKKLESSVLKNQVYVGKERIFDGKEMKMSFTEKDLPKVEKLVKSQWTFLPSSKAKNYSLLPSEEDQYRSQELKKLIEDKLNLMNKSLKAPQDAEARLENGQINISKSIPGTQYDVASLLAEYQKQEYTSEIHLKPIYILPNKEDSSQVKNEVKMLQELLQRTVDYKVQDQVYSLKGSDLIKNVTWSKEKQPVIDPADIKNKIAEINSSQSTLNKNFSFKTHSGSVISVKGESYGWAIDVDKETKLIQEAFEKGEKTISAKSIYGTGWSTYGTGYKTTTNNGIGDTYAEVSIAEQKIWIYKNGQLMVTTNVVTGWHGVDQDTPPGVWYVEFKRSPSILRGSEVGSPNYEVPVTYWAPFTLSGCGFHDAGWRKNWASDAYLTQGSGGCVNVPPSVMASVYDNLVQNEPVVIY